MYISTTRLVLPVCKLGSLPVCLFTTRLIANVFICKKAFTSSAFIYNNACTASVLTSLTASVFIYKKALYCQCVFLQQCWLTEPVYLSTTRLVLPVCKLGALPVCLSTTRLFASVFIYNKACTFNVLTRLTDSVFIYNKACTASVDIYNKACTASVFTLLLTASVFIYYKA